MLHIYHAEIGGKQFQFSTEFNRLTEESYRDEIAKIVEEVSGTMLDSLEGEDALCVGCRAVPAVKVIHHTMLFDKVFPPRVEDLPQPVCASPECAAVSEAKYMMDMEDVTTAQGHESPNGCFNCHSRTRRAAAVVVVATTATTAAAATAATAEPLLRCGKCKTAKYCCPECQRADWKIHKKVCDKA